MRRSERTESQFGLLKKTSIEKMQHQKHMYALIVCTLLTAKCIKSTWHLPFFFVHRIIFLYTTAIIIVGTQSYSARNFRTAKNTHKYREKRQHERNSHMYKYTLLYIQLYRGQFILLSSF